MTADLFIQAVLRAPGDDAVRLVYADWLEEPATPAALSFDLKSRWLPHH